jgi:hypothetical protein
MQRNAKEGIFKVQDWIINSIRRYLSKESIQVWNHGMEGDYCLINQLEVLNQPLLVRPLPDPENSSIYRGWHTQESLFFKSLDSRN